MKQYQTNNQQRKCIAITGGIGSGKSTVLNLIKQLGYPVFSCDEIYRELRNTKEYLLGLKELFPQIFANENADFKKLAQIVFENKNQLLKLNSYAHPLIVKRLLGNINQIEGISFAEVPLLFESNLAEFFDYIIILKRAKQERIESVRKRDGISEEEVLNRISNQFDYENNDFSNQKNIFILDNNQTLKELNSKLEEIIIRITQS